MKIYRTDEARFQPIPDYPFQPNYVSVGGLRIHYVDEGNRDAEEIVLMLHGEPSWSYLYRKMIPILTVAGFRVIAPDLIGFGKSDKPAEMADYSYEKHVNWIADFIEQLDLRHITLVCQDWGGLIGLRVAAEHPHRFKRITASNTFLPTGAQGGSAAFTDWKNFAKTTPDFNVGKIVSGACHHPLSRETIDAYDAPFPNEHYKAGARIFPELVPTSLEDPATHANISAWEVLMQWGKPFLTCFSDGDPITKGLDKYFQQMIPGAKNQKHITIKDAGHFVQEDKGEEWSEAIVQFIKET